MASEFEQDQTVRVSPDHRILRIQAVELTVVDGVDRGVHAPVHGGVCRVGTAQGNELRLTDATVSRFHCEIRVRPDGIALRDNGSTNGTYVDGVRLREGHLPAGARVRVGNTVFRVEVGNEPALVEVSDRDSFGELVGGSFEMRALYAVLERIAPTDTTLLVQGETGTGKELVARSLHAASRRAGKPFIPVDCSAIPENLFESELFGHVRGAFSGAISDRKGVFEEASAGTLFLDELGEIPLPLQAKLLRALETRTIRRVGSNLPRPVDVRIVAATNRPLSRCVNLGTFREDLYYRLAVVEVHLPALHARSDDIPLLARHIFARIAGPEAALPLPFLDSLVERSWPGNVRELRNYIERHVSLGFPSSTRSGSAGAAQPRVPSASSLESLVPLHLPLKDARHAWMETFEHVYVRTILKKTRGNVTRAAEQAGVSRRFLQRMVARLGINAADVGADPRSWSEELDE